MESWSTYSFAFGPVIALGVVGVIVLLCRWTFRRGGSLVEHAPRPGRASDYGLLVAIAAPPTYVEGEMMRARLQAAGVRATLAQTSDGPRIMVFPQDEMSARRILAGR